MIPFSEHQHRITIRMIIEDVFEAVIEGYTDYGLKVTLPRELVARNAVIRILEHYGYMAGENVWLSHLNQICMKFEPLEKAA